LARRCLFLSEKRKDDLQTEDTTKYGETIPTMFSWVPIEEQKMRAEELDKMTKTKKKN